MANVYRVDGDRRAVGAQGGAVHLGEVRMGLPEDAWFGLGAVLVVIVCGVPGLMLLGTSVNLLGIGLLAVAALALVAVVARWLTEWVTVVLGVAQGVVGMFTSQGRREAVEGIRGVPGAARDAVAAIQPRTVVATGVGPLRGRWRPGFDLQTTEGPVRISASRWRRRALERLWHEISHTSAGE